MKDLAKEFGMSPRAISQALHPRESNVKLSPKTIEQIQKLAAKRGYTPDASARSMRYGRFFNIGYFEASPFSVHYPLLGAEAGIFDAAAEKGYRVVLVKLPKDLSADSNAIPLVFREAHLDALIVSHLGNLPQSYKDAIKRSKLPIIYLNEKQAKNTIYVDDLKGGEVLTNYLISQGYRKISCLSLGGGVTHYSVQERKAGYEAAMRAAGLTPEFKGGSSSWEVEMGSWLGANRAGHAIFCIDDLTALRMLRVVYRMRKWVPDDVAIVGFGGDNLESSVPLTTMRIPFYDMARAAVELAIKLVENPETLSIKSQVFDAELVIGSSTRSLR